MATASTSENARTFVCGKRLRSTQTLDQWEASDAQAGANSPHFVVKKLRRELADNPRLVEQFVLRGQRAQRLCHVGIARVVDVVVETHDHYLVTEAIDGITLRELLDRLRASDNALPVWFAVHVALHVSLALEHAHSAQDPSESVYHQEVSPENIVLTAAGNVLLIDFGLGRSALLGINAVGTRRWTESGEFDLWAPHFGDAQTDIQGLGRVLYELLTGRLPSRRALAPSHHAAWISPDLDRVVARMLATTGADRFIRVHDVCEALGELVRCQRQAVDSSHLAGLLQLITSSYPKPTVPEVTLEPASQRSKTMLPGPGPAKALTDLAPVSQQRPDHDWDAAVTGVKTKEPRSATESFERGLEKLKSGDLAAAEAEWLHALEVDPNHRLSLVNLKLLRKLRDSERPAIARP